MTTGGARRAYLHLARVRLQKLLAAGETEDLRLRPRLPEPRSPGRCTRPEFTMLEWYRAHEPYDAVMNDCVELCRLAVREAGKQALEWRGSLCLSGRRAGAADA